MAELGARAIANEIGRIGTQLRQLAAGLADGDAPTQRDIDKVDALTHRLRVVVRGVDPD